MLSVYYEPDTEEAMRVRATHRFCKEHGLVRHGVARSTIDAFVMVDFDTRGLSWCAPSMKTALPTVRRNIVTLNS